MSTNLNLVFFVALRGKVHPWVVWAAGSLAHSQTLISALLACQKHDIRVAVLEFWSCGWYKEDNNDSVNTKSAGSHRRRGQKGRIYLTGSVCHGSLPQQRSDYGFDGETDASSFVAPQSEVDVERVPEQASPPPTSSSSPKGVPEDGKTRQPAIQRD